MTRLSVTLLRDVLRMTEWFSGEEKKALKWFVVLVVIYFALLQVRCAP